MTVPNAHSLEHFSMHILRLQEDSPVLVGLYDPNEVLRYANKAFRKAYGIGPDEVISWNDILRRNYAEKVGSKIETEDFEAWLAAVRSRRGKQAYRGFEVDLCDGRWFWMTQTQDEQGWLLVVSSDISALRAGERGLRVERDSAVLAALTDTLTGISNRAHIFQLLEDQVKLVNLGRRPGVLALLDLDNFKKVNDTYGHRSGDEVLKHFASVVCSTLRRIDGFGRLGGEEFILLLPETDSSQADAIVQRILKLLEQGRPLPEHPEFSYTCSAGLVLLSQGMNTEMAYQRADQSLYEAKQGGRNRVVWAK